MQMVAVVLAGGSGQRFGADVPKQLLRLDGRTLIEHCVAAFDQAPGIDEILVVMPSDRIDEAAKLLDGGGYRKLAGIIEGGLPARDPPAGRSPRSARGPPPGAPASAACCCTTRPGRSSASGSSPIA